MVDAQKTLRNLYCLQELVKREEALDALVETTVAKLLDYERGRLKEYQKQLQEKLEAFEKQYGLSTAECSRAFRAGHMGDAMDFFEWSALADLYEDVSRVIAEADKAHDGSQHP